MVTNHLPRAGVWMMVRWGERFNPSSSNFRIESMQLGDINKKRDLAIINLDLIDQNIKIRGSNIGVRHFGQQKLGIEE